MRSFVFLCESVYYKSVTKKQEKIFKGDIFAYFRLEDGFGVELKAHDGKTMQEV